MTPTSPPKMVTNPRGPRVPHHGTMLVHTRSWHPHPQCFSKNPWRANGQQEENRPQGERLQTRCYFCREHVPLEMNRFINSFIYLILEPKSICLLCKYSQRALVFFVQKIVKEQLFLNPSKKGALAYRTLLFTTQ